MTELTPIYAFRRKGQPDFCTCSLARYSELGFKQHMYEVEIFYYPHQVEAALEAARQEIRLQALSDLGELQTALEENAELKIKLAEAEAELMRQPHVPGIDSQELGIDTQWDPEVAVHCGQ